jgi:TatD DNase family protein
MLLLPFDAHNHIHLGRTAATDALPGLGGMAIMATHPRDFDRVLELSRTLPVASCRQDDDDVVVVPCLGVHPWFVVELSAADWALTDPHDNDGTDGSNDLLPTWLVQLETLLVQHPRATVGEIGLDGFRFDAATQQLVCPMERQVTALRLQLELAARLQRPVSIHVVQAFGPLMTCLADLKKKKKHGPVLPPRLYFHAFGGKLGTVDQLLALCGREPGQVYFGFAPLVSTYTLLASFPLDLWKCCHASEHMGFAHDNN